MSIIFRSRRNAQNGKLEWAIEREEADSFYQDVARSAFADMLHDQERNKLYYKALENVIADVKRKKQHVHVVDIGTGTGLLSMMAATLGAEQVTAIEAFDSIALLAREIIALNGFSDKIEVISGRSTDVEMSDLRHKGDIAVAEVFDTELIGENALKTFSDAQKTLLKPGARVIPTRAKFFAQVVQSDAVLDWLTAKPVTIPEYGVMLNVPKEIADCAGSDTVHDIQLSEFAFDDFSSVSEEICVFEFDFENPICFAEQKTFRVCIPEHFSSFKKADAVFTWWELDMDGTGQFILSTKPDWSDITNKVWRDHWIQGVYFLPFSVSLQPRGEFWFHACHDEYSFWFSASDQTKLNPTDSSIYKKPICSCSLHQILTRNNIARFNDVIRYTRFCAAAATKIKGKKCICFGDCSLIPLLAAQLGAHEVYAVESDDLCRKLVKRYAEVNNMSDVVIVGSLEEIPKNIKFCVVLVDPFTTSSFLPWHNLHFWRLIDDLRQFQMLEDDFIVLPDRANIMALPVEFEHLWKIRAPAGVVEGFNMKPFDDVVQAAIGKVDCQVEPQPLWEYPSKALANPKVVTQLDLTKSSPQTPVCSRIQFELLRGGRCNGLVFWMDWLYDNVVIDTSGFKSRISDKNECIAGEKPSWVKTSKQAVHFLPRSLSGHSNISVSMQLDCKKSDADFIIE